MFKFLNNYKKLPENKQIFEYLGLSAWFLFLTIIQIGLFEYLKDTTKNLKSFIIYANKPLTYAYISTIATYGLSIGFFIISFFMFIRKKRLSKKNEL
jgi:hypothetical protein